MNNNIDLSTFIKVGNNRQEAYKDYCDFEAGFDKNAKIILSYEDFCIELDKGYSNSKYIQIARLYENIDGTIWYDNEYV